MNVSGTVLSAVALLWGFYQAPFAHIHADDTDHPVTSTPVHWHVHHQSPPNPACSITAPVDDDDVDVGWNARTCSFTQVPFSFMAAEPVALPIVTLSTVPVLIPQPRGHDPPELASKSPRAPPL